jgi:exodeoxyribonuclease V gamma subunit
MNDGAFPRQGRPPGFDLIAREPRRGDRSLRDEDRYLFLESILSARDSLYISYVGQSIRDNSEIPPSVLVSELLDAIGRGFALEPKDLTGRLCTRHRLQAFSRDYFNGTTALFSYADENCEALLARRGDPWQPAGFMTAPLSEPGDEWRDITLSKLLRFFDNPARFLLETRLGIRLEEAAEPLEEREPFAVEGLAAYDLKKRLLDASLLGEDAGSLLAVARGRGVLPPARHGEVLFATALAEATEFAGRVREHSGPGSPLGPLDFQLELGRFRLSGRLDGIWRSRKIRYRCAKMKARDQVRTWIEHLLLNAAGAEGYPRESLLLMANGSKSFAPVDDAGPILGALLDLYWRGLSLPLRFFPESSLAYAHKGEWNLDRARDKWRDGFKDVKGEGADPWFRLCFGQMEPFDGEFEEIARALLGPLVQHRS